MDCNKITISIKRLLTLLLSTSCFMLSSCIANVDKINEISTYVVNRNSMKVHSISCGSGKKISDKNRMEITDTISNICSKGYRICKNCNAGMSKKNVKLLYELPSKIEYLNSIDEMGKWYVDHIPTYQKEIEEISLAEYLSKNDNKINTILEYSLIDRKNNIFGKKRKFNVLSSNTESKGIDLSNSENINITCANENAIINYKENYKNITFKSRLAYYNCGLLENSSDDYNKAGDDCVRFIFSVMNSIDKDFTRDIKNITEQKWNKINSTKFYNDKGKFLHAMVFKGFEVFDSSGAILDFNRDGVADYKITEIDNNFVLEKGDLIVRKGHVHIYLGDKMLNADNFGWGKVNRVYPSNYTFSIFVENDKCFIVCDHDKDENGKYNLYSRVYRYKGGDDEK